MPTRDVTSAVRRGGIPEGSAADSPMRVRGLGAVTGIDGRLMRLAAEGVTMGRGRVPLAPVLARSGSTAGGRESEARSVALALTGMPIRRAGVPVASRAAA